MYELKHSFIKGVDKRIAHANCNHIAYISGNCGVLENIITGKQTVFVSDSNSDSVVQQQGRIQDVILSIRTITVFERSKDCLYVKTYDLQNNLEVVGRFEIALENESNAICRIMGVSMDQEETKDILLILLFPSEKNDLTNLCVRRIDGPILCECEIDAICTENFSMSVTPFDSSVICIQGPTKFWFYRTCYTRSHSPHDFVLKLLNIPARIVDDGESMTSHTSMAMESHVTLFATNKGRIFITESGIVQKTHQIEHQIACIEINSQQTVFVGCSNIPLILVYSISMNMNEYILELQSKIDVTCGIPNHIIFCGKSMDEMYGIVTVKSGTHESEVMSSHIARLERLSGEWKVKHSSIYLMDLYNKDAVITSQSIQNGIFALIGKESLILLDEKGAISQTYKMTDIPITISLHPSGHHILFGFEDEVRCDHILDGELKTFWRMPGKNISTSRFSANGEKIGIIKDCMIIIVDFISGDVIQELRHSSRVLKFIWLPDNIHLISHNDEGVLYHWNSFSGEKETECVRFKGSLHMDYIAPCLDSLWLKLDDSLQVLSSKTLDTVSIILESKSSERVTMMASSHQCAKFVIVTVEEISSSSTSAQSVRLYTVGNADYIQVPLYDRVNGICLSSDDQFLYVFMSKGAMIAFEVSAPLPIHYQQESHHKRNVLVSDSYLQEKEAIEVELKALLKEEESNHNYRMELLSLTNQDELARRSEEWSQVVNAHVATLEQLQTDQQMVRRQHQSDMEQDYCLYQEKMHDLEMQFSSKMEKSSLLMKQKQLDFNREIEENKKRNMKLNDEYSNKIKALEQDYEIELSIWNQKIEKEMERRDKLLSENQETLTQTEYEIDQQVQSTMKSFSLQRDRARERILKAKSENSIVMKKTTALQKTIEERIDFIQLFVQRQEELKERVSKTENILKQYEEDLAHKSRLVQSVSNDLSLMQKNQITLTKSNEKYQERIDEMKVELDALQNMDDLKKEMDVKEHKLVDLEQDIESMKIKMNQLDKERNIAHQELKRNRERHAITVHQYESIQCKLKESLSSLDVQSTMKKLESTICLSEDDNNTSLEQAVMVESIDNGMAECEQNHILKDNITIPLDIPRVETESQDARVLLEQEFKNHQKKIAHAEKMMEEAYQKKMEENQKLLKDIDQCRMSLKQMKIRGGSCRVVQ